MRGVGVAEGGDGPAAQHRRYDPSGEVAAVGDAGSEEVGGPHLDGADAALLVQGERGAPPLGARTALGARGREGQVFGQGAFDGAVAVEVPQHDQDGAGGLGRGAGRGDERGPFLRTAVVGRGGAVVDGRSATRGLGQPPGVRGIAREVLDARFRASARSGDDGDGMALCGEEPGGGGADGSESDDDV